MPPKKRSRLSKPKYIFVDYGDHLYLGRSKRPRGEPMGNRTFFNEDESEAILKRGQDPKYVPW